MAEFTAVAQQTVEPNQVILFTDVAVRGNNSIMHREGSGLVSLRGLTCCQPRARFRVSFGGNIAIPDAGTVEPISVAIAIDGEPVASTRMIVTPAAVEEFFNVSRDTHHKYSCKNADNCNNQHHLYQRKTSFILV